MRAKDIVLGAITLGLVINLLANEVWHYLPDRKVYPYTYHVATFVLVIICILLFIFGKEDSKEGFWAKLWQKLAGHKYHIPRKTVKFIPDMRRSRWSKGTVRGEPAMHLHSEWYATNVTDEEVRILRAYLVRPRTEADILFVQHPELNEFGKYPILPRCTAEVSVGFWIQPPIRNEGENFKGQIVFIDQFNNKHKTKVTFEGHSREGELILSLKPSMKFQNKLNDSYLPKEIRKNLQKKGVLLSNNLDICREGTSKWVIKDPKTSRVVYIVKILDKKLNLYKRFIPPPRQRPVHAVWTRA